MRVPVPKWFYDLTTFVWLIIFLTGAIILSFVYTGWQQVIAILVSLVLSLLFIHIISDNISTIKEKWLRRNFKRLNEYLVIADSDESRKYIRSHPQFQNRNKVRALENFSTKLHEIGNIAGELLVNEKIRFVKEFIN